MKEPSTWKAFWIRLATEALTTQAAIQSPRVPSCFRTIALTSTKIANHSVAVGESCPRDRIHVGFLPVGQ